MVFHCWTYRNEHGQWCVTDQNPNSDNKTDFDKFDEIEHLLRDLKKDLSGYANGKQNNTKKSKPRWEEVF